MNQELKRKQAELSRKFYRVLTSCIVLSDTLSDIAHQCFVANELDFDTAKSMYLKTLNELREHREQRAKIKTELDGVTKQLSRKD